MHILRTSTSKAVSSVFMIAMMTLAASARSVSFTRPSDEEFRLHRLINEYRAGRGLPAIRLSKSLTHVAQVHARDTQENPPSSPCNGHSWSGKGTWTPCCYTPDHRRASCMWDKPKELTNYTGIGFECGHWNSAGATADSALQGWKGSPAHNAVILNTGTWSSNKWKSIGVGMYGTWAYIWFGESEDPDGYWEEKAR